MNTKNSPILDVDASKAPRESSVMASYGIAASLIYLAVIVVVVKYRWSEFIDLDLNALGDFSAGVFGPLAIFWLILGYMQQGKELKQNTEALRLQVDELKNSVEQQSEMVRVARESNQLTEKYAESQRKQAFALREPKFNLIHIGVSKANANWHDIEIRNDGETCTYLNTTVTHAAHISRMDGSLKNTWGRDKTYPFRIGDIPSDPIVIEILWKSIDGHDGESCFDVWIDGSVLVVKPRPKSHLT